MDTRSNPTLLGSKEAPFRTAGSHWKFCFWLFIASLAVNSFVVWLLRRHEMIHTLDADEQEYWRIGGTFFSDYFGHSGADLRRTPAFPFLVAALRFLFGSNYFAVQLALSAILALVPVLVFWLVQRQLGSYRAAKFASLGSLLWPPFVRYGVTLYTDPVALLVFLVYLLAFPLSGDQEGSGSRRWVQFCISGALLSVCMQVKPLYLIYVPFAIVLAMTRETTLRRRIYAASFLVAGCVMMTLPWSTYISLRSGHFIPLSANDGETLAGGINPTLLKMGAPSFVTPDGRVTWGGPGKWVSMDSTGYLSKQEMNKPYAERSELLKKRVYEWIKFHPADVAYLTARKLLYMWGIYPFWNGAAQTLLGNGPLLLLMGLALLSLWINRETWLELALFWTLPLFSSAVCMISWGSWRFRLPGDVGLIVLAAIVLANWTPLSEVFLRRTGAPSTGPSERWPRQSCRLDKMIEVREQAAIHAIADRDR